VLNKGKKKVELISNISLSMGLKTSAKNSNCYMRFLSVLTLPAYGVAKINLNSVITITPTG
jgi:hypothetical protein